MQCCAAFCPPFNDVFGYETLGKSSKRRVGHNWIFSPRVNSDDDCIIFNFCRDKRKPQINLVDVNKKCFAATPMYI